MNDIIETNLGKYLSLQLKRFLNTLIINLVILLGLIIFWAINIYSSVKEVNNPPSVRLLIYDGLVFFTLWALWTIIKNALGYYRGKELSTLVETFTNDFVSQTKLLSFPVHWLFYGSYYHLIEQELSLLVPKVNFHQLKEQQNLTHLNVKLALVSIVLLLMGVGSFLSMVFYFHPEKVFAHWEAIFTLCLMVFLGFVVFGFTIPRQVILNQKIKQKNQNQLDEDHYFNDYRYFALTNTLTKFWFEKSTKHM